jgi:hypothetical protein
MSIYNNNNLSSEGGIYHNPDLHVLDNRYINEGDVDFSDYYTKTQTDTFLLGKSDTTHNHDSSYFLRNTYIQMADMLNMNDNDIYNLRAFHNTLYPIDNPANKILMNTSLDFQNNVNNITVKGVITPINDGDVSNKKYVDDSILTVDLTPYIKKDGTTTITNNIPFNNFNIENVNSIIGNTINNLTFNCSLNYSYVFNVNNIMKLLLNNNGIYCYENIDMNNTKKL